MLRGLRALLALLLVATLPLTAAAIVDGAEAAKAHALFERAWEDSARFFPEWASFRGDHRHGDRLSDASPAGEQRFDRQVREWLAEARSIDRSRLGPQDRISLDMFISQNQRLVEQQAFPGLRTMTLGALGGVQSRFAELMQVVPTASKPQVQQLLARMAAYPGHMDQQIERLQRGIALGFVPSRDVLDRVLLQIDAQLPAQLEDTPFWRPFTRLGPDIPEAERALLQAAGRDAVEQQVLPALRRLRAFVAGDYRAQARVDGAMLHYPDGQRIYAMQVAHSTTTRLTPRQIHDLGLRELARLRPQMEAVLRTQGFTDDFPRFVRRLSTDPKHLAASPEALLAGYREIGKRIDGELPRLFAELPRTPWGVRPMPAHMDAHRAEYYQGPAMDGSRAGFFFANAAAYRTRPLWAMETLVAHEAVPGHHLQGALAMEQGSQPPFRRYSYISAYGEGWALYAEELGIEMGIYRTPYERFGQLTYAMWRACRLVVDTGIHAKGWTRQQAVDYMLAHTALSDHEIRTEVDRYISWPGQALSYMIGMIRIRELRREAEAALGPGFDLRAFHDSVLGTGSVPLPILSQHVRGWIEMQRAR